MEDEGTERSVSAKIYKAAVKGRRDFREAYRRQLKISEIAVDALSYIGRSTPLPTDKLENENALAARKALAEIERIQTDDFRTR